MEIPDYLARLGLCILILFVGTFAHPQVVVIQNNQTVSSGDLNQSIQDLQRDYFVERVGFRIAKQGDYGFYSVLRGIDYAEHANPQIDGDTLRSIASDEVNYYDDPTKLPTFPGQDSAINALTSLVSVDYPYVGAAIPVVLDQLSAHLAGQIEDLYPIDPESLRVRYLTDGPDGLGQVWKDAQNDPKLKPIVEDLISKRYGTHIGLDDNPSGNPDPEVQQYQTTVEPISGADSPEGVAKAFETFAKGQQQKMDQLTKEIRSFESHQRTSGQEEEKLSEFKQNIDDQRAVSFLVATSVGIINPTLGRTIGGIGDAYLKIAEADGLYRYNKISSLRLTADVVSAGLELASLLNRSGPTADEIILEQLKAISQQIESFRQEMNARFDRVDESLSRMYVDLIANFNEVNKNVARAREGIIGLQVQLADLQGQLGELDTRVQSYAQGLSSQLISSNQEYCVNPGKFGATGALTSDQFTACAVSFTTNGTLTAKSAVWTSQSTDYLDDDGLLTDLNRPIEQNLNFLWALASARFDHRPAPYITAANPVVWAANATGYIRLLASARPVSTRIGPTDDLIRAGTEIQQVIQALGRQQSGTKANEMNTLFDRLIPYMTFKFKQTESDVAAFEHAYQKTMMAGYDPWGRTDQQKESSTLNTWTYSTAPGASPLDFVPNIKPCADALTIFSGNSLPIPANFASLIPYTFRMAEELGLGQVNACYTGPHWTEQGRINGTDAFSGKLAIGVVVTFTPVPSLKSKPSKKSVAIHPATTSAEANSTGAESKDLLITRREVTSTQKWTYDCVVRVPEQNGSLNTLIARKECVDKRANGMTDGDLAEALPSLWNGSQGLQQTFIPSVSKEGGTPEEVSKGSAAVEALVQHSLAAHRTRIRREVIETIRGGAGSPDFVAEERLGVIKDFRELRAVKALVDAYVGLTLSNSSDTDENLASALGELAPNNWAVQIAREGGLRIITDEKSLQLVSQSRVLAPLSIPIRADRLRTAVDKHLRSGSEPYALIESTLEDLKALRVLQLTQSLSTQYTCFASDVVTMISNSRTDPVNLQSYRDQDTLAFVRVLITPSPMNSKMPMKTDILIGNSEILMSGAVDERQARQGSTPNIMITFPGNGIVLGQLRRGVIRICNDYGDSTEWSAASIRVEISKTGNAFDPFRLWTDISFPKGARASIVFRGDEPTGMSPAISSSK